MQITLRYVLDFFLLLIVALLLIGSAFQLNAQITERKSARELMPENGRLIQTPFGRTHITEWGRAEAPPIVMTHGMAAWGGLWEETATYLADRGYRVIAVDLPPFGFSDRAIKDFSRSSQAKRLAATAKAMGLTQYFLVGHSYGGGVAMEAALRYPDHIAGVVLVCPVMNLTPDDNRAVKASVPIPLRFNWLSEMLVSVTITNPLLTGYLTKRFMYQTQALTDRHIEILQRPMARAGNTAHMVTWLQQFLSGDPDAKSRKKRFLTELRPPLSLIWGTKDTVTPIEQGNALAQVVKPLRFTRLDDIGHMPQLETSTFSSTLLQALTEMPRRHYVQQ